MANITSFWKFSKLSNSGISLNWSITDELPPTIQQLTFLAHPVNKSGGPWPWPDAAQAAPRLWPAHAVTRRYGFSGRAAGRRRCGKVLNVGRAARVKPPFTMSRKLLGRCVPLGYTPRSALCFRHPENIRLSVDQQMLEAGRPASLNEISRVNV